MPSLRLFVTAALRAGAELPATPSQTRYLGTVMRRRAGDPVRLFNGRDGEWLARLLHRDPAALIVDRPLRPQAPEPDLWLIFALLKRDATDLVVQKATELGAAALMPVLTERTVPARVNPDRLASIATEAAEQSERLTVPTITAPQPLATLLGSWPTGRPLIAAVERRAAPSPVPMQGPTALLVGPEGGFTPAELEKLLARPFVSAVSLGPRILRADTACIAGLALLQAGRCCRAGTEADTGV